VAVAYLDKGKGAGEDVGTGSYVDVDISDVL